MGRRWSGSRCGSHERSRPAPGGRTPSVHVVVIAPSERDPRSRPRLRRVTRVVTPEAGHHARDSRLDKPRDAVRFRRALDGEFLISPGPVTLGPGTPIGQMPSRLLLSAHLPHAGPLRDTHPLTWRGAALPNPVLDLGARQALRPWASGDHWFSGRCRWSRASSPVLAACGPVVARVYDRSLLME